MDALTDFLTSANPAIYGVSSVLLREWLNGSTFPLMACLTFVLAWTLGETWRTHGRGWSRLDGIPVLCTLFWLFLADTIRSGLVWATLWYENDGLSSAFLNPIRPIGFTLSAVFMLIGGLRLVRIITPRGWGERGWIWTVAVIVGFVVTTHFM